MHLQPTPDEVTRARRLAEGRATAFKAHQDRELTRTSGVYYGGYSTSVTEYDEAWIEQDAAEWARRFVKSRGQAVLAAE